MQELLSRLRGQQDRGGAAGIYVLVTGVLGVLALVLSLYTYNAYNEAAAIQQKNEEMRTAIHDFEQKAESLNGQKSRPVSVDQLNSVQSDLLLALKSCNLTIDKISVVNPQASGKKKEAPAYRQFDISCTGTYADTVKFIEESTLRDALFTITSIKMQESGGKLHSSIKIRVYHK